MLADVKSQCSKNSAPSTVSYPAKSLISTSTSLLAMSTTAASTISRRLETLQERVDFLQEPLPKEYTENITGNAPQEVKEIPVKWLTIYRHRGNSFACKIAERIKVVDVSVVPNVDDPLKKDGRVTTDIEVTPGELVLCYSDGSPVEGMRDMCNAQGMLHDGCKVFLIDE